MQPNQDDGDDGRTAVHDAALADDTDALLALITGGADPNAADALGAVPLHCAAHTGAGGAVRVLLDAGAQVDAADHHGNTPLMIAVTASNGDTEIPNMFLVAGADPSLSNYFRRTPAGMAQLLGHLRLQALLGEVRDAERS